MSKQEGQIQTPMTPPPVAMQFVVTLYFAPDHICADSPHETVTTLKNMLEDHGQPNAAVAYLSAPTHDGAQDG